MKRIIGLDIGTSSAKALLIEGNKIIDKCSISYSPDFFDNGYAEQDPSVWWDAAKSAIKEIIYKNPGDIFALAASGQMHSSVFLDKSGDIIRKAILWNDTRTSKQVQYINEIIGEKRLLELISNRALDGFTLPKILWLKDNEPNNFKKLSKVIMPKDYINYKLTGKIATDLSDAAGTMMLSVDKNEWNKNILNELKISIDILPELLNSTDVVGTILPKIANELGINDSAYVIAGGADNSCAAIGTGIVKEGQSAISIGTSGTVIAHLDSLPSDIDGTVHLFNYSISNKFYAMACMLSAGESLNWLKNIIQIDDFDEFNKMAESSPSGANGIIFLPYLFGERCPYPDPNAKGIFFGLKRTATKEDMVRSVMEGVAFNIKAMFELVQNFSNINEIIITGGGAKSQIWSQIISNILEMPIKIINIEEGPAFGAAIIASVGSKIYKDFEDAKENFIKIDRIIHPKKENIYKKQFEIFKKIYEANKNLF